MLQGPPEPTRCKWRWFPLIVCIAAPCGIYFIESEYEPIEHHVLITGSSSYGATLQELARDPATTLFLEVGGKWYSGGSAGVVAEALGEVNKDKDVVKQLYIIEAYRDAYADARELMRQFPVVPVLGGTVPVEDWMQPDELHEDKTSKHFEQHYTNHREAMKTMPPLLKKQCEEHAFDVVIIDGSEYSAWGEFQVVRDACKPSYIVLHDFGTIKTKLIANWFAGPGLASWEQWRNGVDKGSGWAVFRKKKAPTTP